MRVSASQPPAVARFATVAVGAGAGALARAGLGLALPTHGHDLPLATLVINLTGCLAMGLLTPLLRGRHPLLGLGLTTGALGGFTTFSTFALDIEKLTRPAPETMAVYLFATVLGCLLAYVAGIVAGERLLASREQDRSHGAAR